MPELKIGSSVFTIEALILDKDGTLNNSLQVMPEIVLRRAAAVGRLLPEAAGLEAGIALAMGVQDGQIQPRSVEMIGSREQTASAAATVLYLERQVPWDRALRAVLEAFAEVERTLQPEERVVLFPGLHAWLEKAARNGFRLALATNDTVRAVNFFLHHSGLRGIIRHWACVDEVPRSKPYPEMALLAAKRLEIEPGQCAVVGDSAWDLEMGRRAGAGLTVGVLSGSGGVEDLSPLADVLVERITAIELPGGERPKES